jgi:gliding motility-associated-like protein
LNEMKVLKSLLLSCLVFCLSWASLQAQTPYCKNLGFELGDFTNWTGHTWRYSVLVPSINTNQTEGIVSRRQTIMSDTSAYDANTGFALRKIPPGYMYSARLGDEIIHTDGNPRCWEQSLRYTMKIDSANALLIIKFALVLQFIIEHPEINEPRFRFTLYDSLNNILPDCSNYDVYSTNKTVKGFKTFKPAGDDVPVVWRDWTTVGADLSKYMGQTITVEFMAADCTEKYHYGYAYFVAECHPLDIKVKFCGADTVASMTAPPGFEKYKWTNNSGTTIDTVRAIEVHVPVENSLYTCSMTSATGCVVSVRTSITKYFPKADFSSLVIDCESNTVQLNNLSTKTNGTLLYNWDFGEGSTSNMENPLYTFKTTGTHKVTLILSNPPSGCRDSLTKTIESTSQPLVGIKGDSTYCYGIKTYLRAYGAEAYTWSNGSKADSIEVGSSGGTFWVLGRSGNGCISDTIYKTITAKPDWQFLSQGDTAICGTGSVKLSASGAVSYLWNNGNTSASIVTSSPGTYSVTGTNANGCKKSAIFNIAQYPLPAVDFSMSPDVLDSKHNILNCTIPPENGVHYSWTMGDGLSETGSPVQHGYNISDNISQYKVTLTATTKNNCIDSSFKFIEVVLFIPSVFSPNGDGINDVFMAGFELEIIDRNGLRMYKGKDGWDGMYNGKPADPDTYFYLIYYTDNQENISIRKGYLTLLR